MNRRNLPTQIARIRAHLKTRRGRRDMQAMLHLGDLLHAAREEGDRCASLDTIDALLKNYYNADALRGRLGMTAPSLVLLVRK